MRSQVKLKPTPIPRLEARANVLQDFLVNAEIPQNIVDTAVNGFLSGDLTGVTIHAQDAHGFTHEHATLTFSEVCPPGEIGLDLSGDRSATEALSARLAQAMAHSLKRMKVAGRRLVWFFHLRWFASANEEASAMARNNLRPGTPPRYAAGQGPKLLYQVVPGQDDGVRFAHYVSRPLST